MKSRIIAIALFVFTTAAVVVYPMHQNYNTANAITNHITIAPTPIAPITQQAKIEVVFVLDTTGSMGGLIQAAKEKIWSIASSMASAEPAPEIKIGLVAYRDRGDAYVTKVVDLSSDLDTMYATLMDFQAGGGGDGPESVNQALFDAVNNISWSQSQDTYKVVFLIGDAPPHMDYQDDVKFPATLATANSRGILINTIQCGENSQTTQRWQQIAQLGSGKYFQVGQAGSAVAINTPFDKKIAELSKAFNDTRVLYGTDKEKQKQKQKNAAIDKLYMTASVASLARRSEFNATASGRVNKLGVRDLLEEVVAADGTVDLSSVKQAELPASMQSMSPEKQEAFVAEKTKRRKVLETELKQLGQQRKDYIKIEMDLRGGAEGSLDEKIYSTIKEQAGKKGFDFKADAPAY